jgi:hypothetical protein
LTLTGAAGTLLSSRLVATYGEALRLDEMLTMQQRIADVPDTFFLAVRAELAASSGLPLAEQAGLRAEQARLGAEQAGLRAEQIQLSGVLWAIPGMESVQVLRAITNTEVACGIAVPADFLLETATVADLARLVSSLAGTAP